MKNSLRIGLAITAATLATSSWATPVFHTSQATFDAFTLGTQQIDSFSGLSTSFSSTSYDGDIDGSPATSLNVNSVNAMGDSTSSTYCRTGACLQFTGGSTQQLDFSFNGESVNAFGFWLSDFATVGTSTLTLTTLTGSSMSWTFPDSSRGTERFFGVTDNMAGFTSASITASDSGDVIGVDDVQWAVVPTPSTLLLFGAGLLAGAARLRRSA